MSDPLHLCVGAAMKLAPFSRSLAGTGSLPGGHPFMLDIIIDIVITWTLGTGSGASLCVSECVRTCVRARVRTPALAIGHGARFQNGHLILQNRVSVPR